MLPARSGPSASLLALRAAQPCHQGITSTNMNADALAIGSSRHLAPVHVRYVEKAQLRRQVKVHVGRLAIVVDDPQHAPARNVLMQPRHHARGADADSGPQAGPALQVGKQGS